MRRATARARGYRLPGSVHLHGASAERRLVAGMLDALDAPAGALVVVDRGIATEAAISWLRENHYRYLVVSRERHRQFDADAAVSIQTQSKQTVQLHKVVATDPDEVRLYCYSKERARRNAASSSVSPPASRPP